MNTIIGIIDTALQVLGLIILADVILSYVRVSDRNPIVAFIRQVSRAVTAPIRKIVPPWKLGNGYVDFAPFIAILLISLLRSILRSL